MRKIHRKNLKYKSFITGRKRKKRPKTFSTEEAANNYAKKMKYKNYNLENLRTSESKQKKIRIRVLR